MVKMETLTAFERERGGRQKPRKNDPKNRRIREILQDFPQRNVIDMENHQRTKEKNVPL